MLRLNKKQLSKKEENDKKKQTHTYSYLLTSIHVSELVSTMVVLLVAIQSHHFKLGTYSPLNLIYYETFYCQPRNLKYFVNYEKYKVMSNTHHGNK